MDTRREFLRLTTLALSSLLLPNLPQSQAWSQGKAQQQALQKINRFFNDLSLEERENLKSRYGIGASGAITLEDLYRTLEVVHRRVREIEAKSARTVQ